MTGEGGKRPPRAALCGKKRRGALDHGLAGRKVPPPVAFRLYHIWGCLPTALTARPVPNPAERARAAGEARQPDGSQLARQRRTTHLQRLTRAGLVW